MNKEKFAVRNLQKIFDATFLMSPKIGFQAMSLRDLSAETGLSMGGLYSSVSNKESIALMIKDVVAVTCENIVDSSHAQEDPLVAFQHLVRGYIYASTILHPWFNFLYFETKCLPVNDQEASKSLELEQVLVMESLLKRLKPNAAIDTSLVANMALSLIQDRYVKPWKHPQAQSTVDQYADDCLQLIFKTLDYQAA